MSSATALIELDDPVRGRLVVGSGQTVVLLGPSGADLDSLAVSELALRIEEQYGVTFDDDDVETLAIMTLGEFAAEVSARSTVPATRTATLDGASR